MGNDVYVVFGPSASLMISKDAGITFSKITEIALAWFLPDLRESP